MTPKEKAKSLIIKYMGFCPEDWTELEIQRDIFEGKLNSLICVDELIEQISLPKDDWFEERLEYLKEVKHEIHRL